MMTAIVVAAPEGPAGEMVSRIPSFLHPVAGRPLIWHTIAALAGPGDSVNKIILLMPPEFAAALPEDLPAMVRILPLDATDPEVMKELDALPERVLLVRGSACLASLALRDLAAREGYAWLGSSENDMIAAATGREEARAVVVAGNLSFSSQPPAGWERVGDSRSGFSVRNRADLARMQRLIRDGLVEHLMHGGVTFLLPESILIDVDVRIGRDTIVYPGAVLEGQTTIGEETVIGPGCRIIDSWIGSGVELKGWNYISHASVRNRAILEPYVRRGFD